MRRTSIMRTALRLAIPLAAAAAASLAVIEACGPDILFRAYLDAAFWQRQVTRSIASLANGLPPEKTTYTPYAGMAASGGSGSLQGARDAYRALFDGQPSTPVNDQLETLVWPEPAIARVRTIVNSVRTANQSEADELDLLRCKVELRAAKANDRAALEAVRSCLTMYLGAARPAALVSEARGWVARVDFLLGHDAAAAKFYLDELARDTANLRRERLLESLRLISPQLKDLDEYFDTPAHALFAADRITSSDAPAALVTTLIATLENHRELFRQGPESDTLAIALMRASIRAGAPAATLQYAALIAPDSAARATAEFNWLLGTALLQRENYPTAETALKNALSAPDADTDTQATAAGSLVGVYAVLNRPVDELWAAFQLAAHSPDVFNFDAAYLLDVQLTDSQLQQYLSRYGNAPDVPYRRYGHPPQSSLQAVRYAQAVRLARHEQYEQAAALFDRLQSPRAARMREAASLLTKTRAADGPPERRLEALYDYADFLASHPEGVFFNDRLWSGFQRYSFVYSSADRSVANLSANTARLNEAERMRLARSERRLRDDQDEYWRAYQILNRIVTDAGPTPLGRKAAARAIVCVRRINQDRFGRAREIRAADIRLSRWLARR